jgi:hypothetical protein
MTNVDSNWGLTWIIEGSDGCPPSWSSSSRPPRDSNERFGRLGLQVELELTRLRDKPRLTRPDECDYRPHHHARR